MRLSRNVRNETTMPNDPATLARVRFITTLCGLDEEAQTHLLAIETSEERELLRELAEARGLPLLAALIADLD